MKYVEKIKLKNFKRFKEFKTDFDPKLNILVGDNECGKSSILTAIHLVLSGNKSKVESIGLESLFNVEVIEEFLSGDKNLANIPVMSIELYLNLDGQSNHELNGRMNSDSRTCDGLRLECSLDDELSSEVREILAAPNPVFPFEYFNVKFKTFSGEAFTGHKRYIRNLLIDNSQISSEYAIREYVGNMYVVNSNPVERNKHQNEYRKHKEIFTGSILSDLNSRVNDYSFSVKDSKKSNLETDLTLVEGNVDIANKGKGKQCFVKTDFALKRNLQSPEVVLLEEPENHLSFLNMKRLINTINQSNDKQLFISTHSNMISARLDLRKTILLHCNSSVAVRLKDLPEATAKFFIKAPDHSVLDFILSKKVILVEGDAEYILFEAFYKNVTDQTLADSNILVLSVDGTSFKRYLDIAKLLTIKTAVIRDNDGNYHQNCVENYSEYTQPFIKIFADPEDANRTFEICVYQTNTALCEDLFRTGRRTLSVQDFMLANKTEVAYKLLDEKANVVAAPQYIKNSIEWIRE
jgi:putative ATP-dependent endonuclease of the OLD family